MTAVREHKMRQVETLSEGVYLLLDDASADRLERLLELAVNGIGEDIHKFCMTFERASMGIFFMPNRHWKQMFDQRLSYQFKVCDIKLVEGDGGECQWDRDNPRPKADHARGRGRG